jgi:hypothetical protein
MTFLDLSQRKFGRLTAEWPAGMRRRTVMWLCSCECGKLKLVECGSLRTDHSKSCGCLQKELVAKRQIKHGATRRGARSREYETFTAAKQRCMNPRTSNYKYYGARGIQFRFTSFEEFISCLGERPIGKSLDRFPDNNGHYEPGNVRWATPKEQTDNRRKRRV